MSVEKNSAFDRYERCRILQKSAHAHCTVKPCYKRICTKQWRIKVSVWSTPLWLWKSKVNSLRKYHHLIPAKVDVECYLMDFWFIFDQALSFPCSKPLQKTLLCEIEQCRLRANELKLIILVGAEAVRTSEAVMCNFKVRVFPKFIRRINSDFLSSRTHSEWQSTG